jgi:ribosomal protein L34E
MTSGAMKSRSRKRIYKRIPGGTSVLTYREKRVSKPECPTGRELPGTVRGNRSQVHKFTYSERRPSRPYGGVLSSPALRMVMRERAEALSVEPSAKSGILAPGVVCMKLAGRDAGKLCVITEVVDKQFVKIDGFTRPRKVNNNHLEPTGKVIDVKKDIKAQLKQ